MANTKITDIIISSLDEIPNCIACGVRPRFGDIECPKCGKDFYESLEFWAENLIIKICELNSDF